MDKPITFFSIILISIRLFDFVAIENFLIKEFCFKLL